MKWEVEIGKEEYMAVGEACKAYSVLLQAQKPGHLIALGSRRRMSLNLSPQYLTAQKVDRGVGKK